MSKAPHATTITSVDLGNALQGVRALSGAQLALAFLGATTPIVVSAKDVGMRDLWLARLSRVIATYRGPNPPTAAPGSSRSFSIARTIRITDFVSVDAADDEEDSEVSEDDEVRRIFDPYPLTAPIDLSRPSRRRLRRRPSKPRLPLEGRSGESEATQFGSSLRVSGPEEVPSTVLLGPPLRPPLLLKRRQRQRQARPLLP